jgi:signal transduction histidine kinase
MLTVPPLFAAGAEHSASLTTASQVRALTAEQARRELPAKLQGVFMGGADPEGIAFVIQDETDGIYIQGPPAEVAGLKAGDILQIEGVTEPGGFAPYVAAHEVRKVGRGPIPEPLHVTLDEMNTGKMDAKWVEFTGIVRSVEPKIASDEPPPPPGTHFTKPAAPVVQTSEPKVKMKIAAGSQHVLVQENGDFKPEDYVDAEVKVRGLCFNLHNHNRQFVRPFVQVPSHVSITILKPPASKPFAGPLRSVESLLQFQQLTADVGHRVQVRGIVVHHRAGSVLWVRDHDRSLRVDTTQRDPLQPGDEVVVLGFPALGEYSAVLEDAIFEKVSTQAAPEPHVLTDLSSALRYDADLVQVEARLTDVRRPPGSVVLTLEWKQMQLRAELQLDQETDNPSLPDWEPGSLVRVSGVCTVTPEGAGPLGGLWEPRTFQILLRSPADLAVLHPPPWWNAERVVWVLSSFLALALGAVAVVMLASRRRLKEQEHRRAMAETEFTTILSERNRMAREIHDTLSQNLGAICVQLELVRGHADEISPSARNHLGSALKLARGALAEARDSIWNMRSHILEKGDLAQALEGILRQMTDGTEMEPSMRIEGTPRRLPPVVENNLLRIGQEAITNASKHGKPKHIDVTLAFEGRAISLVVQDDGIGFAKPQQPERNQRSFGLVGIRERADLLGGKVEIDSAPGQGTRVAVTVSV